MEDLLKRLQQEHNISAEQASAIMQTVSNYIKEQFPMVGGAVDKFFPQGFTPEGPGTSPEEVQQPAKGMSKNLDDLLG